MPAAMMVLYSPMMGDAEVQKAFLKATVWA